MEYGAKDSFLKDSEAIILMKQQICDFSQKEMVNLRSIITSVDHHIANQRSKQHFQAVCFNQQSHLAFSDLQTYYTRLMVKMTEFTCLVELAQVLQVFIRQSIKLYTFTNEFWYAHVRQLQTTIKHFHRSQPPMEVCLKCSENIRHQEIKQARFNITNLIDDPYLFYQKQTNNKGSVYQEIRQKSLQDKLSQLASGVEFGQVCMRELIDNLTIQSQQLGVSKLITQKQGDMQFIPILKSLAKHVKAQRKQTFQKGIQIDISITKPLSTAKDLNNTQIKECNQKNNTKLSSDLSEKIKEIKNLQQKLQQENKIINEFKNQISVLKEDQSNLQKRNSALEIELNWSKTKSHKNKKLPQPKNNFRNISETIPSNLQAIRQITANNQKLDKPSSNKQEIRSKKSQFSNILKKSINLASMTSNYSQNAQRVFRKTQNLFNLEGSSKSIQNSLYGQEDEVSQPLQTQLPKLFSNNTNFYPSKETQRRNQPTDLNSFNSSTVEFTKQLEQNKLSKTNKLNKTQFFLNDIRQKNRRIGTVYDKQTLLKLLYKNEVNNKSSIDYENFKVNYENLIDKLIGKQDENTKQNIKQHIQSREKSKQQSKKKKLTKHIQKKSTISIRNLLRNEQISRDSSQPKFNQTKKISQNEQMLTQQQRKIINSVKTMLAQDQQQQPKVQRIVLTKKEQNLVTEVMAYLVQLKVQNKLVYQQLKNVLAYFQRQNRNSADKEEKDAQMIVAQIINSHRSCQNLHDKNCCSHIRMLISSITQLIG